MEELLLLDKSEEDINIELYKIIERLGKNDYKDDSLKKLRYIVTYSSKTSTLNPGSIQLIKEYLLILLGHGLLSLEPESGYFSTPILRVYSDNYYLRKDVTKYMDLEDKNRFCAEVLKADPFIHDHLIRTGKITLFDQQAGSELQQCRALGDLGLLKCLLDKTYDLNIETADANQLNYQSVIIDSIISMLLERKVITEYEFSQPNISVCIIAKQKKYFIDKRYLARI